MRLACILLLFSLFTRANGGGGAIEDADSEFWFGEKQVECPVMGEIESAGPEDENPDSCTAFAKNPLTRKMYGNIGARRCCQTTNKTIDVPEPLKGIVSISAQWM